jgi:glycosyltransferase involved in cell wall biosynthesis
MKVVLTTPYYPPHIGGVEVHVQNLARRLKERGYDVEVVSSVGEDHAVKIKTVPSIPIPYSPIPITFPDVEGDVFHSHIPSPFFAKRIADRNLKPHVVTYHNDVVTPEKVDGKYIPPRIRRIIDGINEDVTIPILDSADVIIATTKSYAETSPILSRYEVKIVPNAVDVSRFEYTKRKEDFVLYVGRLVEYKGLPTLLEAMRIVQAEFPIKLVIVGDGEDRSRFEALARKLGVMAEFKGRVQEDVKIDLIKRSRVLVLPSKSRLEAFGIVLLEAMACGTPVIGSNIAGVRDVAKEGGLVFYDIEDLAEKILKLITNDKMARALGRRGRKAVEEKYDWSVVIDKIEKIYADVL